MLEGVFPNMLLLTVSVALPFLAALAVWGLGKDRNEDSRLVGVGASCLSLIVLAVGAFRFAPGTGMQLGDRFEFWPEFGVSFTLAVDGLSLPFALLLSALATLGVSSARQHHERALVLMGQTAALLIFLAQDLFLFLAAWWALPLLVYALLNAQGRGRAEYAATKLLVMLFSGAALLTVSLLATYLAGNGNASMAALWIAKPAFPIAFLNHAVLAGILLAAAVAMPLFPFHTWLADAYDTAPPSVLPLVVGGLQAGGAYAFVRLAMGYFPSYLQPALPWLAALGVLTALYAVMAAWGQRSLMRGLAMLSVASAGLALAGFSALAGPETSPVWTRTLLMLLAATSLGGMLAWASSEITRRAGALEPLLARLGFLAPRGAKTWLLAGGLAWLLVAIPGFGLLAALFAERMGLAIGMAIALLLLLATGALALRRALVAPATPAFPEGVEDLSKRELALGWGVFLLAAIPMFWLILGNRAIAVFASQLSLGFLR